jgi:hypothetical protein
MRKKHGIQYTDEEVIEAAIAELMLLVSWIVIFLLAPWRPASILSITILRKQTLSFHSPVPGIGLESYLVMSPCCSHNATPNIPGAAFPLELAPSYLCKAKTATNTSLLSILENGCLWLNKCRVISYPVKRSFLITERNGHKLGRNTRVETSVDEDYVAAHEQ